MDSLNISEESSEFDTEDDYFDEVEELASGLFSKLTVSSSVSASILHNY